MYDIQISVNWCHCTRCGCQTMTQVETNLLRGIVIGYDAYCFGCGWGRTWSLGGMGVFPMEPTLFNVQQVMGGR